MTSTPTKAVKLSLSLDGAVHAALAAAAYKQGEVTTRFISQVLMEYCIQNDLFEGEEKIRAEAMMALVKQVTATARGLVTDGQFAPTITRDAIAVCLEDERWLADYETFIKGKWHIHGNPLKGAINREMGYQVKRAVRAKVIRDEAGEPLTEKVSNSAIQSFTLLEPDTE